MNMTAAEFRRAHLVLMIEKSGTAQAFADDVGLSPSYVSQLVSGNREIGHKTARKIEGKKGMPVGAMDLPPATSADKQLVALLHAMPEDQILNAFSSALPKLSPEGLRQLTPVLLALLSQPTTPQE